MNTTIPTIPLTPKDPPALSTELNVWWDYKANGWMMPDVIAQDSWTFAVHKNKSGVWVFSILEFWVINESLCGGTELVIDSFFKDLTGNAPQTGDTFIASLTTKQPDTFKSVWSWTGVDSNWEDANTYTDSMTNAPVWLCPLSQELFGIIPKTIWINY